MTRERSSFGRHVLLASLPLAAIIAVASLPGAAFAQRGDRGGSGGGDRSAPSRDSGSRGGGGSTGSRDSSPRRDYSPPQRDSSPRRDYSPPQRDSSPRRDYSPPQRDYTPRRDYSPSQRDTAPRRDYTPSTPRDSSPRRDYSPTAPRDGGPRRDYTPRDNSQPRWDYAPRRDVGQGSGRDTTPTRREPPVRRENALPGTFGQRNTTEQRRSDLFTRGDRSGVPDRAGDVHRDPVREQAGRSHDFRPSRDRAFDTFTRSDEGRRFHNGIDLRRGHEIEDRHIRHFFPQGFAFYPYYCPTFQIGISFWSPYSYYYDVCPPYVYRWHVFHYPPPAVYIEVPIYVGDSCRGYNDEADDYYLNSGRYNGYDVRDPALQDAMDQIRDAFRTGNIQSLVDVTDPAVKIAVFLKGKYEYSQSASDYLDMTRDALANADTVTFDLYRVRRRADSVYVVSGNHVYRNPDGQVRTVYVSFVLERINGRMTLTQIGTAPDRIQEP